MSLGCFHLLCSATLMKKYNLFVISQREIFFESSSEWRFEANIRNLVRNLKMPSLVWLDIFIYLKIIDIYSTDMKLFVSQAKSPDDGEMGLLFMQEILELTKLQNMNQLAQLQVRTTPFWDSIFYLFIKGNTIINNYTTYKI